MKRITELKNMRLSTDLSSSGGAVTIVAPDSDGYTADVERVASLLERLSDARPLVLREQSSHSVALPLPRIPDLPIACSTVILIGTLFDSPCMRDLYGRRYVFADGLFPGSGGRIVRTVHNPNGDGRNFVVLSASAAQGVSAAVDRFLELTEASPILPHTLDVVSDFVPGEAPWDLNQRIDSTVADILANGRPSAAIDPVLGSGYMYCLTGGVAWADAWRHGVEKWLDEIIGETESKPTGRAEFWSWQLIHQWDLLEESSVFTDSERLSITNRIFDIARRSSEIDYMRPENLREGEVRWNHQTFNALGCLFGGTYFSKYYDRPEAGKWLEQAHLCFNGMRNTSRSWDEAGGYGAIVPLHLLIYGLYTSDPTYFDAVDVKGFAERAFVHRDPMGAVVNHGDGGGWSRRPDLPSIGYTELYWEAMAALRGDGRYRWMLNQTGARRSSYTSSMADLVRMRGDFSSSPFATGIDAVHPRDHVGTTVIAPLDRKVYDADSVVPVSPHQVTQPKSVDKIAFREGLRSTAAYLLWDGFGGGKHGHQDANAIVRLSDRGRVWLADGGYNAESTARYHNGLLVIRDGRLAEMPPLCRFESAAGLGSTMLGMLTLPGYGGLDWTRCIVRRKRGYFLVLDRAIVQEPGAYDLRLSWRWLGRARLTEGGLAVTQQGASAFQATSQPGGVVRDENRLFVGRFPVWEGYPYADPVVRHFEQRRLIEADRPETVHWATLISTAAGDPPAIDLPEGFRVEEEDSHIRFFTPETEGIAGFGDSVFTDIDTSGTMYLFEKQGVWVIAGTRRSRCGALTISSDFPVTVEVDWPNGRVAVHAERETRITLEHGPKAHHRRRIEPGRHVFALPGILPPEFPGKRTRKLSPPTIVPSAPAILSVRYATDLGSSVTSVRIAEELIVCGSANGTVHLLDSSLHRQWSKQPGGRVNDLLVAVGTEGAPHAIVTAHDDRMVRCYTVSGDSRWSYRCPNGELATIGRAKLLRALDVDGEGNDEILVGTAAWWVISLSDEGGELWRTRCYAHTSLALETGTLNARGERFIVQANEYYYLHAIDLEGTLLASRYVGRWASRVYPVILTDLNGDGRDEVICGASDGLIRAFTLEEEPVHNPGSSRPFSFSDLWQFTTGGEVTALTVLSGDGPARLVAGSEGYRLTMLAASGTVVWNVDIGFPAQRIFVTHNGLLAVGLFHVAGIERDGTHLDIRNSPAMITSSAMNGESLVLGFDDGRVGILEFD